MNKEEFIKTANVGNIVQITWTSTVFEPDTVLTSKDEASPVGQVYSCGYVAQMNKEYVAIAFESLFQKGDTNPSFRSILTIPFGNIVSAEVYGKLSQ